MGPGSILRVYEHDPTPSTGTLWIAVRPQCMGRRAHGPAYRPGKYAEDRDPITVNPLADSLVRYRP